MRLRERLAEFNGEITLAFGDLRADTTQFSQEAAIKKKT